MAGIETIPSIVAPDTSLAERFRAARALTSRLAGRLTPEDQMVQSFGDASPVKWHLAHSTWFFETFVLREFQPGYRAFDEDFFWLFNSYYHALGDRPEKKLRASFSRPSLQQVLAYRAHVESGVLGMLAENASAEALERIELGMHHEQQHQELIATDIKHAFWSNPLQPAYDQRPPAMRGTEAARGQWCAYAGGLVEVGHSGDGFAFDIERSRHRVFLAPFRIASKLVTCAEYLEFMRDGGYLRPELWLSDGWETVVAEGWQSPLYWHGDPDGTWKVFTLHGKVALDELLTSPVCHVSYYEADAYARWAGSRLPTEFEWEHVASSIPVTGNFLESGVLHPLPAASQDDSQPQQMFGDVWEWTGSAYAAYPGYRTAAGALGEYNGKFMCSQMVLRGGSVVTPLSHIRASYRNFFPPATRWQFSGIRVAADGVSA